MLSQNGYGMIIMMTMRMRMMMMMMMMICCALDISTPKLGLLLCEIDLLLHSGRGSQGVFKAGPCCCQSPRRRPDVLRHARQAKHTSCWQPVCHEWPILRLSSSNLNWRPAHAGPQQEPEFSQLLVFFHMDFKSWGVKRSW